jgi:hypothetical protein
MESMTIVKGVLPAKESFHKFIKAMKDWGEEMSRNNTWKKKHGKRPIVWSRDNGYKVFLGYAFYWNTGTGDNVYARIKVSTYQKYQEECRNRKDYHAGMLEEYTELNAAGKRILIHKDEFRDDYRVKGEQMEL